MSIAYNTANRAFDSSAIVVVRTSGERTFDACRTYALRHAPNLALHVVDECPFEVSLRKCYQIGIDSGAKWVITVDADVLLRNNALVTLITRAEQLPESVFQAEGLVFDKLLGRVRKAGHRIYRGKLLSQAISCIPNEGTSLRPESTAISRMSALGYPSVELDTVLGIHDFEQYYSDIYRKSFVHAHKHTYLIDHLVTRWRESARFDADYLVALRGLTDGLMFFDPIRIDSRDFEDRACSALHDLGLEEKGPLLVSPTNLPSGDVEELLRKPLAELERVHQQQNRSRQESVRYHLARLGVARAPLYLLGAVFSSLGSKMKRMSDTDSERKD